MAETPPRTGSSVWGEASARAQDNCGRCGRHQGVDGGHRKAIEGPPATCVRYPRPRGQDTAARGRTAEGRGEPPDPQGHRETFKALTGRPDAWMIPDKQGK